MKRFLVGLISFLLLTSLASAATLQVGPTSHYKTIQSAVNDSRDGDTILVANGSYTERVNIGKSLTILGAKSGTTYTYPRVYGFSVNEEAGTCYINGFKFTRYGVSMHYGGSGSTIRNNYFTNCGIVVAGIPASDQIIINNQITNGTMDFYDTRNNTITGCTFTKCNPGVYLSGFGSANIKKNKFSYCKLGVHVMDDGTANITSNTFSYCDVGIHVEEYGNAYMNYNTYIKNKVKIIIDPKPV